MRLQIAETFHSIKGEGLYYGVPMFFIRFAGCTVGKVGNANMEVRSSKDPSLKVLGTTCTTYDGREFGCDTDYKSHKTLDLSDKIAVDDFFRDVPEKRVVLTGGEPLAQRGAFEQLMWELKVRHKIPHIETSGTIEYDFPESDAWVACAPKLNALDTMMLRANELKLLVDVNFNFETVPKIAYDHPLVFVCPINMGVEEGYYAPNDRDNLQRCIEICQKQQNWRVGFQLHKLIGVR